jgi:hypothetical protein
MNDNDLMTAVRDSFAPVRMNAPAPAIMARGGSLRRHRHGKALAASALAVSLGAGLSVSALAAGPATAPQHATLAAWTVTPHPDGSVGVTVRQPRDLAALQAKLAKLGIRVLFAAGPGGPWLDCRLHAEVPAAIVQLKRLPKGVIFQIHPGAIPPRKWLLIHIAKAYAQVQLALGHQVMPVSPAPRAQVPAISAGKTRMEHRLQAGLPAIRCMS